MELYLMQHGQALSEEENPERPLSEEGVARIKTSAKAIRKMGIGFEVILASAKKRSRQTAALVAEATNYPYSDIVETEHLKPEAEAEEGIRFLRKLGADGPVLLAGHLPSIAGLASTLLTDRPGLPIRFENGGLCRIDVPSDPALPAELRFCLTPEQLRIIAG